MVIVYKQAYAYSMNGDYYALFGIDEQADELMIKKAYRALSKLYHPDVNGDQRMMVLLNRAYEVLSNPARRAAYDRTLAIVRQKQLVEHVFAQPYQKFAVADRPISPYLRRQKTRLWAWMTAVGMASA
jgi:DnaJ-class molecular chaperone